MKGRTLKKNVIYVLGVVMCISLVACGKSKESTSDNVIEPVVTNVPSDGSNVISSTESDPIREKEPLITESYIKSATEEDVVFNEEDSISYVKNQLVVITEIGTPREVMEQLAEEVGADIVGYLEGVEFYQFEFRKDMSYQALADMITYLEGIPYVNFVDLNLVTESECNV